SMAMSLSSPYGCPSDEEEEMAVFESTAAEHGGLARPRLPEISVISPGLDNRPAVTGPRRLCSLSFQGCVAVQDEETLLLKAPKESQNMRTAERGITQSMHKFSFSKIFGPETTQQQFYECTMKNMVKDVLRGENGLLYTYGVTNSGKTYTIQGCGREAGLLPRALVSLFRKLQGRIYSAMDLKPVMYQDQKTQLLYYNINVIFIKEISYLGSCVLQDENTTSRRGGTTTIWDSGVGGLSSTSNFTSQLEDTDSVCLEPDSLSHSSGDDLEEGVQFSIWVSFYEIYNEFLYDLLDASPSMQPRKRATMRLSEDKLGNTYVKELTWIQVRTAEEAWKILKAGRRNQSFASTHLNQNSSRSHSIFSIRVLHIPPQADSGQAMHISELTVCDLAGSERSKEQRNGERMKEANNINTSLLTLGRCIASLRHNQNNKSRPPQVVPFRDSKLTRVLQGFFCGRGTSSMVVNINPCASIYDETLQALKFSAIATQVGCILLHLTSVIFIHLNASFRDKHTDKGIKYRCICFSWSMDHPQRPECETLEAERALVEERCEDRISNLQKHLKKFYSQELLERDQEIEALSAALDTQSVPTPAPKANTEGLRRSERLTGTDLCRLRAELDQCRAELLTKTQELTKLKIQLELPGPTGTITSAVDRKIEEGQRNLRQLRLDIQRLGVDLQSGERACCRNTGGERLRQALTAADETLSKQDQILLELQNSLTLIKADLRRKAETLAQTEAPRLQLPPSGFAASTTPGFCKKRGCAAAAASDTENRPPQKRPLFHSLFPTRTPTRKYNTRAVEEANITPYSRVLRSRQQSPPPSPLPSARSLRGKY
uniref:Kinesin-like protein n=1 Tax=Anabas testudineus TaxID=64144 RepID=A0A7N6BZR5_ANATE